MSIEGGIRGNQQRLVCPNCGKVFFAWRPDDLPGQKVKCYFCKHEFADEAALRPGPGADACRGSPAGDTARPTCARGSASRSGLVSDRRSSHDRSEQRPDARGQRHGEGSPERDAHGADGHARTAGARSHAAQEREEYQ